MIDDLKYVKIDKNFKDLDKVQELFVSSFPAEERPLTLRQALEMKEDLFTVEIVAVYDGDKIIGFYAISDFGDFKQLAFLATDSNIRGKGYGGSIVRKILEDNKEGIIIGGIEKPVPGEDNYEIKLRRRNFYERNGMIITDIERTFNGIPFLMITNKDGDKFEKCFDKFSNILNQRFEQKKQI